MFDKGGKSTQWRKDNLPNKWCWENWTGTCKKNETRRPTYTKINSQWIKDLNVSHETIIILEENVSSKSSDIQCRNIFAHISAKALETKQKINK